MATPRERRRPLSDTLGLKGWGKLGKQNIQVFADPVSKLMTDVPHMVQPGDKAVRDMACQLSCGFERLPEHS